jgi:histidine triad (HIT) family protein
MENCIFCKIVGGQIPSTRVYETESVYAFADINPGAPKHILVIPKQHITSAADLAPEHSGLIAEMILASGEIARQQGLADTGYRLVTNIGKDGGQSVYHLHWHILGGRPLAWPPG